MFSGIITHTGKINKINKKKNNCFIEIKSSIKFKNKEIGSSISCSGVCLTLENFNKKFMKFYLSRETLKKSIFNFLQKGDLINLEKSLIFGDRISGHFVQGHVDCTSKVKKIQHLGKSWLISFKLSEKYRKYIVQKGSITINGVSLTVSKILNDGFQISIIPHTLKLTNLVNLKINDHVNVEFDIMGKYIKNFLKK
tara:strand:- start:2420 stop:3007 length:588 start_codon:yes stop_codon:yes gene_type:complete